MLRHY
jgi:hypothetical protein